MEKGTNSVSACKPTRPHADYPLCPRRDGRWSVRIGPKVYTFSGTADEALAKYEAKVAQLTGQAPSPGTPEIRDLCNAFLTAKQNALQSGELSQRSFDDYKATTDRIVDHFGSRRPLDTLTPADAEALRVKLVKGVGLVTQAKRIRLAKIVFKFGEDYELPTGQFRRWLKGINAQAMKRHRGQAPSRLLTAEEIRSLIDAAEPQLKAMILLGINAGFGNHDCGDLELGAVDIDDGWVNFPRPKTGERRRVKLWDRTVKAIKDALAMERQVKDPAHAGRVFITRNGQPFVSPDRKANALSQVFRKLAKRLKIHRPGLSFYSLRHTFETTAGNTGDQVAVNLAMGHSDSSMAANYRHGIDDARLVAIADHVESWLFQDEDQQAPQDDRPQLRVVG